MLCKEKESLAPQHKMFEIFLKVRNIAQLNKKQKITIKNKVKLRISTLDKQKSWIQKDWFYIRKAKSWTVSK